MDAGGLIERRPRVALSILFVLWKSCLLSIALLSPGIGYDTSTDLLYATSLPHSTSGDTPVQIGNRLMNLVRWDAIYYSQTSQRGLRFEQEWAFGIGLPRTIAFLKHYIFGRMSSDDVKQYIYTGVILSHAAHWAAVMLLYSIANLSLTSSNAAKKQTSFVCAVLHILSPAGIFMSAPYAESTFACLNLLGYYLYLLSVNNMTGRRSLSLLFKVLAGVTFGLATLVRSNGILSGLIFLLDAFAYVIHILNPRVQAFEKPGLFIGFQFTIIAGMCIAIGALLPQYLAYQQYCTHVADVRSWCKAIIPSIFTFVQSHYWNVGFLRYWTVSNLPLFLLAAPQLIVLMRSGLAGCKTSLSQLAKLPHRNNVVIRLALPQIFLAILAFFSYHVQIISRLSSGYPFWYMWLALNLRDSSSGAFIRFFIMYGMIQAGLYASFLPPA